LERLVDLVEAVAVLGGHWMLHDEHERLLRIDRRAGTAELLEDVTAETQVRPRGEIDRRAPDVEHPRRVLSHRDHALGGELRGREMDVRELRHRVPDALVDRARDLSALS